MTKTPAQIEEILDRLADETAADVKNYELDFVEWDGSDSAKSTRKVISTAMGFRLGGTIVIGIADGKTGRDRAIVGVPPEVSVEALRSAVRTATAPAVVPVFEEMTVPEGTGRLILLHAEQGVMFHMINLGEGTAATATMSQREGYVEGVGEPDFTAETVDATLDGIICPSAMESLRKGARKDMGHHRIIQLPDADLLAAVGVLRDGRPTRAAVLLAGSPEAVRTHVPGFNWAHVRMSSSTECSDRAEGNHAVPVALDRMLDRIMADNPIEEMGEHRVEFRIYSERSLRAALQNALCHCDLRAESPVQVNQYDDRVEIVSPGRLVGGVTPRNILRHGSFSRNPCLADAMAMLRLFGASGQGMERIFSEPLDEGKPPPTIEEVGESVRLTFWAWPMSLPFRLFAIKYPGRKLISHEMLVVHWLMGEGEIDLPTAARLCHVDEREAYGSMEFMEKEYGALRRVEAENGNGPRWALPEDIQADLAEAEVARVCLRGDTLVPAFATGRGVGEEQNDA